MVRAASLERPSPAATSGAALIANETHTTSQRWSVFSRGGRAATVPAVDEATFLQTSDTFWDALDHDDIAGVQKSLRGLSMLQRERLLMTPSASATPGVWAPKLPLCCTVAAGQVEMTQALLEMQANPWMGDPWVSGAGGAVSDGKQPAATPAYWGVIYGQTDTLRAVYKHTRSTLEARRALCQAVHPEVLTWLVKKDVTSDQLAPAMIAAIGRNDAAGVRLLARIGRADVNALCPTSDLKTSFCSLLAYAMETDHFDAAGALVELGAKPTNRRSDAASKNGAAEENFPLTKAIKKGQVGLVRQMLQASRRDLDLQKVVPGAPQAISDATYLLAAFEAPNVVETYMAMYREGLKPKEIIEAEVLLAQAKDRNLEFLYAFISRQRTMLLLGDEKHGTDAAKRLAKAALDELADALAENPDYATPGALLDHAQAMNLEALPPTRSIFNVFNRWGAKKGKQAGNALADAAGHAMVGNVAQGPFLLGM